MGSGMKKTILLYGAILAVLVFLLEWLEYQYTILYFSTEVYIVCLAILFTLTGIWVGRRLTPKQDIAPFEPNQQALTYLAISEREYEVLTLLAEGLSNKELADRLFVSTNTIKTHLKNLYEKLEVSRRTQAVQKARALRLIP